MLLITVNSIGFSKYGGTELHSLVQFNLIQVAMLNHPFVKISAKAKHRHFCVQSRLFDDVTNDEQDSKKIDHPVNIPSLSGDELQHGIGDKSEGDPGCTLDIARSCGRSH